MTVLLGSLLLPLATSLHASPLSACAEHFIGGQIENAPTLFDSAPDEPFGSNLHFCYRVKDISFFAMEYWLERLGPRWTAYRLSGEPFGPGECNTYTRKMGNCYINETEWIEPFECNRGSDPFHSDHLIEGETLNDRAFVNSGLDRGHIAPRQALSWHVCGAYQTFTMANMSPQNAALNQGIWGDLEHQVLTWAIDHGPLHVVSGTTYRFFPHWRFSVYRDGALNPEQIYPPGSTLEVVAEQMSVNAEQFPSDHILHPLRTPNPDGLDEDRRSLPVPTGYFKVIYRPATSETPAQAIGFLLPHAYERLDRLADHYEGLDSDEAYWGFVSRIEVIEAFSGIRFPGISDELKRKWRSPWFFERRGVRQIRSEDCGDGTPAGVLEGAPREDRRAACQPLPFEPD